MVSLKSRALALLCDLCCESCGGTSRMLAAALTPDDAGILKDKDLKSTCTARACVRGREGKKEKGILCLAREFIV